MIMLSHRVPARRRWCRILHMGAAIPLLLWPALVAASPAVLAAPGMRARYETVHLRVDVGGYRLYLQCAGTGAPTLVLDDADYLDTWNPLQDALSSYTRTCDYDREGLGLSDPGPAPITSGQLVRDLYRLLRNAGIAGPYVLVGVRFGATTMRLFASRHRGEVAGLVLLDAIPPRLLPGAGLPSAGIDIPRSQAQVIAAGGLGAAPLLVVSHEAGHCPSSHVERSWQEYQQSLAGLSTNSVHIQALRSGCDVLGNTPQLVTESIKQVLVAVRRDAGQLGPCGVVFAAFGGTCVSGGTSGARPM